MTNLKYLRQFASIFVLTLAADAACSSDQALFGDSDEKKTSIPAQPNIKSCKSLPDLPKFDLFSNEEGMPATRPVSVSIRNKNKSSNSDSAPPEGRDEDAVFGGVGAPNAGDQSQVFLVSSKSNLLGKEKEPSNLVTSKLPRSSSAPDLSDLDKKERPSLTTQFREHLRKSGGLRRSQEKENQQDDLRLSQELDENLNANASQKDRVEKKKSSPTLSIRKAGNKQNTGSSAPKNRTQGNTFLFFAKSALTTTATSFTTTTEPMGGDLGIEGIGSNSRSFLTSASARLPRVGSESKAENQVNDGLNPIGVLQNFLFSIEQRIVDKNKEASSPLQNTQVSFSNEEDYLFRLEEGRIYELGGRLKKFFMETFLFNLEREIVSRFKLGTESSPKEIKIPKGTEETLSDQEKFLFAIEGQYLDKIFPYFSY